MQDIILNSTKIGSDLSENNLKTFGLSGTLTSSPQLPCHQCDVITLSNQRIIKGHQIFIL